MKKRRAASTSPRQTARRARELRLFREAQLALLERAVVALELGLGTPAPFGPVAGDVLCRSCWQEHCVCGVSEDPLAEAPHPLLCQKHHDEQTGPSVPVRPERCEVCSPRGGER